MVSNTTPKVHMGTITGGEARALYATNPVILLPMGSHEDQGPQMPMGDYLVAEKIAELAALQANLAGVPTVVAPVLPFGGADWFGPMPGGIAISPQTLTAVVTDMIADLHRNGLTRLIVINGHSGNVKPVTDVARSIYRQSGRVIPCLSIWKLAYGLLPGIIGAETAARSASHGADPLTSVGLHLMPELMRPDLMAEPVPLAKRDPVLDLPFTGLGTVSFEGAEIDVPNEYDDIYTLGVGKGDARLCSAETGAALTGQLTDICARFIAHFANRTPS